MRLLSIALAAALFLQIESVSAQQLPLVEVGSRVRVFAPHILESRIVGTVAEFAADSMVLHPDGVVIPLTSVLRLDVSGGKRISVGKVVGLGLGGAIVGGAVGYVSNDYGEYNSSGDRMLLRLQNAGLGAGVGFGVGLIAGFLWKADRWEEVPLDRLRVSFAPRRDGRFEFGLTFAY